MEPNDVHILPLSLLSARLSSLPSANLEGQQAGSTSLIPQISFLWLSTLQTVILLGLEPPVSFHPKVFTPFIHYGLHPPGAP